MVNAETTPNESLGVYYQLLERLECNHFAITRL